MQRVSSLVSRDIGNYLTNKKTWDGILYNVKSFGAKGDRTTDDAGAIQAAIDECYLAGGGFVLLPDGGYYVGSSITVKPKVTLGGMSLGTNVNDSNVEIIGALSLSPIVELNGGGASAQTSLRYISVTRELGTIPAGVEGVKVTSTDYSLLQDVNISRHAIGLNITGQLSCNCERVVIYSVSEAYASVATTPQVTFIDCSFGRNGGENGIVAIDVIRILNGVDTFSMVRCQLNPTTGGTQNAIHFKGYNNENGYFYFTSCHIENMTTIIKSDSSTLSIPRFIMQGSTVSNFGSNPFIALHANTVITEWIISNCIITGVTTFTNGTKLILTGNRMIGSVLLDLDNANVTGNIFFTGVTLTGVWNSLVFANNVFDGLAQVLTDTSTGKKHIMGNVSGSGYNNINVLSDVIQQEAVTAPTLLNGWVNFGGGYSNAGFFKDSLGIVHLRGVIKSGTVTPGTDFFVLPAGYRPATNLIFPTISSNGTALNTVIEIASTGQVRVGSFAAGSGFLPVEGITFKAEQ